ncbi:helix-turn-helix domain-containing protein [Flavobacteriaceae bacterium F89]|uniref:Helix-turn-helix domain-containing protein n=1 Tax=Cerina litoralis TaxID=2874477 RepID=A0AAE3JR48_9FLAO|nr:helix-turn-helix transcriptional regulator [Cerina litoralis]MCG2462569.1 helix-turn-helix domain-containing protein [Cerina litoralis]
MGNKAHNFLYESFDIVNQTIYMEIDIAKDSFIILFGGQLEKLRKGHNLSLRQLATRCNIDYSDISKIEKGKRNIQLSTVLELSKGLNIHPKELLNFDIT